METIKYTTDLNTYTINAEVKCGVDKHAGADIDGNRGREERYIDEVIILSITDWETGKEIPVHRINSKVYCRLAELFYE